MFENLKKGSTKIFVFMINILLMAMVALLIREKDQERLLEQSEKNNNSENNLGVTSQSVQNISSFEGQMGQTDELSQPAANEAAVEPPQPQPVIQKESITTNNQSISGPTAPQNNPKPNRKTKTS